MYDIAVVGAGLFGSAALRHLALAFPELRVCAVGPEEPKDRKTHEGVFASHYDQGRITRVLDPSPLWGQLARASIARYPGIESASGVKFHHRVGCLRATDIAERVGQIDACAAEFEPPHQRMDAAGCKAAYPFLSFSDEFVAWDEGGEAGYVNPRQLIEAQLGAAQAKGAAVIREIVSKLDCGDDCVTLETREGRRIQARKALVTAGGYSNTCSGGSSSCRPNRIRFCWRKSRPPRSRACGRCPPSSVPLIIPMSPRSTCCRRYDIRMARPLSSWDRVARTSSSLTRPRTTASCFPGSRVMAARIIAAWLKKALHRMIPALKAVSYQTVPCLITRSAHGNPYVDALVDGRLYLATAGNGYGAKSSDEIGRLGAMLCAADEWQSDLERAEFRAVYADGGSK